jgi:hypothetical protein
MYPFAFEIGGRNQNTQPFFSVCFDGPAFLASFKEALEAFCADLESPASFALFSADGVFAPLTTLPKSRVPPGVFGVLDGAPNDANAPEPRLNAWDAPAVGDGMAGDVRGIELNGLTFPCEDESPNRFPWV